jgi:hypothetical protein
VKSRCAILALFLVGCFQTSVIRDSHGCRKESAFDCSDICDRADFTRCPAWIKSDLTKPGICMEECRGVGAELLHCRLYARTCSDAYMCYSMLSSGDLGVYE